MVYLTLEEGRLRTQQRTPEPVINPMSGRTMNTNYLSCLLYNVCWTILHPASSLIMLLLLAKGIALYGASWVLWKIFKQFIIRSPLDNIPGPSSQNWWKGMNKQAEIHLSDD